MKRGGQAVNLRRAGIYPELMTLTKSRSNTDLCSWIQSEGVIHYREFVFRVFRERRNLSHPQHGNATARERSNASAVRLPRKKSKRVVFQERTTTLPHLRRGRRMGKRRVSGCHGNFFRWVLVFCLFILWSCSGTIFTKFDNFDSFHFLLSCLLFLTIASFLD